VLLLCLVAATGCASAQRQRANQLLLTRADALVLQGCYDCLKDARALYEQALPPHRPTIVLRRLFETELLIALREKELALDARPAFARAHALASELPSTLNATRYLALAEAVPPDDVGTPRRARNQHLVDHRELAKTVADERAWLGIAPGSDYVRRYLSLALECSYPPPGPREPGTPAGSSPLHGPPLLIYRAAICFPTNREALERLRTDVPRFSEISFFLGRLALPSVPDDGGRKARELMQAAYSAIPLSSGVTYLSGSLNQMAGDCRTALRFYDETVAREPLHEDALLGRAACLSMLGEADAAIATATRLIEMRADNQGDAYYWRAWNHHRRADLPRARTDIDRGKTLRFSSPVLTLAGIIEHDQNDLPPAESDLVAAKSLDPSNCVARWYLALVSLKREAWVPAATEFVGAMDCYRASALDAEARMRVMALREDLDPAWRAAQLTGFEAAIKEDRSQQSASAYNAAVNFLRGGDRSNAVKLADLAAEDPVRLPKVEELRKLFAPAAPPR
jgi:tetratricopeptide (TPR) repeat protein